MDYWREQQAKITDNRNVLGKRATDRSRLFKTPETKTPTNDSYEVGPTIPPDDFVKSDGSDCGKLVSEQLEKINVFDYSEYSDVWNPDIKRFEYSKMLIGMYYGEGNVWKRRVGYTSEEEVSEGKDYIINEIDNKRAVKVMIDYAPGTGMVGGSNPYGGDHAVTIVGYGSDKNGLFYLRFYDHGTKYKDLGTNPMNRLYWNEELKIFKSDSKTKMLIDSRSFSYSVDSYVISHVRLNKK